LKLADFGLAVKSSQSDPSTDKKSFAGTLAYSSPEMILSGNDVAADYWSLGVQKNLDPSALLIASCSDR